MKKMCLLLLTMIVLVSCQKKNTIEITVSNMPDNTEVELSTAGVDSDNKKVIITGKLVGGKVVLDNPFNEFDEALLSVKAKEFNGFEFFFIGEPGSIKINLEDKDYNKSLANGTENNDKFNLFSKKVGEVFSKRNEYNELNKEKIAKADEINDTIALNSIDKQFKKFDTELTKIFDEFESDNKNNAFGMFMLSQTIRSNKGTLDENKKKYDAYPSELKESIIGKKTKQRLQNKIDAKNNEVNLVVGDKLPDFKALTPEGKEVTLKSFLQDKNIVLVDVWASWCGPCRKENPNVVNNYKKYNAKGFDIVGYSIDRDGDAWKKAIEDDKLTWMHVSNLKFWKDPIIKDYGIKGVPANFLIDNKGVILGINLREEELGKKLEELFNKK